MKPPSKLAFSQIERRLKNLRVLATETNVRPGWITYMREAICMTQSILAKALGVNQATVQQIEKRESAGKVTIQTMQKIAAAMDCEFVYAFVPKQDHAHFDHVFIDQLSYKRIGETMSSSQSRINVLILLSVVSSSCSSTHNSKLMQPQASSNAAHVAFGKTISPTKCIKNGVTFDCVHGIFALNADTAENPLSVISLVENDTKTNIDKLHFSPDGSRIAFLECTQDLNGDSFCDNQNERVVKRLVVSNIDGTSRTIIGEGMGGMMEYPTWSPDGSAILYVKSEASNPLATDLFAYSFASKQSTRLTNTPCLGPESQNLPFDQLPDCMETDNHWGQDGTIAVVKNKITWGPNEHGNLRPKVLIPNNVYSFPSDHAENIKPITSLGNPHLPIRPETSHCCFADPRVDRSSEQLFFVRFEPNVPGHTDSDIISQNIISGKVQDLSQNDKMDLYPMQNKRDQLYWTRFDSVRETTSYVVFDLKSGRESKVFDVFGAHPAKFYLNGIQVRFESIGWGDWAGDKIAFPATISFPNEN